MATNLKIGIDTSTAKRDLASFDQFLRAKGKSSAPTLEIFDKKELQKSLTAVKDLSKMREQGIQKLLVGEKTLTNEIEKQKKAGRDVTRLLEKRVKLQKALTSSMKELKKERELAEGAAGGMGGLTAGGRFMGGVRQSGAGRRVSGGLGLFGKLAGMGKLGMLTAGAATTGIGIAATRGFQGYGAFSEAAGQRLQMRGRGLGPRADRGLLGLGFGGQEARSAQLQAEESFGKAGATGAAMKQRGEFARGFGLDLGRVQGAGAGLRETMGTEKANKTFAMLQSKLISAGITESMGPYLETTANMLTAINEDGLGFNDAATTALLRMAGTGKGPISPEMAAKTIIGMDQTIKNAKGPAAMAIQSAFAAQGLGGGTIGGTRLLMEGGLLGGNLDIFEKMGPEGAALKEQLKAEGMGATFEDKGKAILEMIKGKNFKTATAKAQFLAPLLGGKGLEPLKRHMLLKRAVNTDSSKEDRAKAKKEFEELGASNEQKMVDHLKAIRDSVENKLLTSRAFKGDMQEQLGEGLAPIAIAANELLMTIDTGLVALLGVFTDFFKGVGTIKDFIFGGGKDDDVLGARTSSIKEGLLSDPDINKMSKLETKRAMDINRSSFRKLGVRGKEGMTGDLSPGEKAKANLLEASLKEMIEHLARLNKTQDEAKGHSKDIAKAANAPHKQKGEARKK